MKRINLFYLLLIGILICIIAASCNTTDEQVLVTSISLDEEFWLNKNSSVTLMPIINPPNAANKDVWWINENEDIVEVDQTGTVTALEVGEALITAFARDGSRVTSTIKIIVPDFYVIIPDNLVFNNENYSVYVGNSLSLGSNLNSSPEANLKNFIWESSNSKIAEVNQSGHVTGISAGEAVITAYSFLDPDVSANVKINVNEITGAVEMTPQEIFNSLKGQKIITYGWADMANNGNGLSYANPANLTLIDDATYPNPTNKYMAFINTFVTNANINPNTGVISGGTVNDNPKFVILSGDIDLSNGRINDNDKSFYDQFEQTGQFRRINGDITLQIGSNTTIIGINNARIKFGGLRINNRSNIIFRNIIFWDAHGSTEQDTTRPGLSESKASIDALEIRGTSNGIWVDHCHFSNGTCTDMIRNFNHDGALDIPAGRNITVSWTEFTNVDKVMLVAGSDTGANLNVTDRHITLHHNYFHYTTQRMPRTRGTQMHVYNNYYNDIGVPGNNGYCMGPGVNAQFIVENNYFGSMRGHIVTYYDNATYPAIVWSSGNNSTVRRSIYDKTDGSKPWSPAYVYSLEDAETLPVTIPPKAGPTLMFYK